MSNLNTNMFSLLSEDTMDDFAKQVAKHLFDIQEKKRLELKNLIDKHEMLALNPRASKEEKKKSKVGIETPNLRIKPVNIDSLNTHRYLKTGTRLERAGVSASSAANFLANTHVDPDYNDKVDLRIPHKVRTKITHKSADKRLATHFLDCDGTVEDPKDCCLLAMKEHSDRAIQVRQRFSRRDALDWFKTFGCAKWDQVVAFCEFAMARDEELESHVKNAIALFQYVNKKCAYLFASIEAGEYMPVELTKKRQSEFHKILVVTGAINFNPYYFGIGFVNYSMHPTSQQMYGAVNYRLFGEAIPLEYYLSYNRDDNSVLFPPVVEHDFQGNNKSVTLGEFVKASKRRVLELTQRAIERNKVVVQYSKRDKVPKPVITSGSGGDVSNDNNIIIDDGTT